MIYMKSLKISEYRYFGEYLLVFISGNAYRLHSFQEDIFI